MSDFNAECPNAVTLDPYKRVCYSNGLVLGVDEFLQEELYLLEKHRLHNRALHGYGTVCGLAVTTQDAGDAGPEVVVSPGLALNPIGHEIRVPTTQCARINEWLLRHPELLDTLPPGSPSALTLYVVLCYRECKTDEVPIPGGPCRTLEDSTAPSRIADAFELHLRTEPPEQFEEDAVRAFGDLLRLIEVTDGAGGFTTVEEMEELVRGLITGSPPGFEPFLDASPPGIQVLADDAVEVLRAAFRVWVTEVRPTLLPDGRNCASGPPRENCVLLAQLDFGVEPVGPALQVLGDVAVDDDARPYLLQTRVLQECCLLHAGGGAGGPGAEPPPVITVHADLTGLDADDHPQYLLVDPASRALIADLDADGAFLVSGMRAASANGEAVRFEQAVKVGDTAGAPGQDVRGTYPDVLRVVGLQDRPVLDVAPAADEVLTWNGAAWEPQPLPPPPPSDPMGEENLVRIVALNWRHDAFTASFPTLILDGNPVFAIAVAFGFREANDGGRARVENGSLDPETFQLFTERAVAPSLTDSVRVAGRVVPLDNLNLAGGLITDAITGGNVAPGAALVIPDAVIRRAAALSTGRFLALIRGDHVLEESGERAIDAEHLRSNLPTGDRPAGVERGIQGGRFESWFQLPGIVDLNLATEEDLTTLDGINVGLAQRILRFREVNGPFTSIEQLLQVPGIGNATFQRIRPRITV